MTFDKKIKINKRSEIGISTSGKRIRMEFPARTVVHMDTTTADDFQAMIVEAIEDVEGYFDQYQRYE